jgi:hypothetical protein
MLDPEKDNNSKKFWFLLELCQGRLLYSGLIYLMLFRHLFRWFWCPSLA